MNPNLEWVTIAAAIEEDPYDKFRIRELGPVELPRVMPSSSAQSGALLLCFHASQLGFPYTTKRVAALLPNRLKRPLPTGVEESRNNQHFH
jgi:hypothetical protein